jgi:hypothetical protein
MCESGRVFWISDEVCDANLLVNIENSNSNDIDVSI